MNGYQVLALARDIQKGGAILPKNNVKIIEGSILDQSVIQQAIKESNAIVHLAAATSEKETDYRESYKVNVTGSKNLIDLCMKHEVKKFITLSSESTKRKIQGNYAKTKSIVDDLVRKSNLEYTLLRPSIVYGPGSKGLFGKMMDYIRTLPVIPIIGDGKQCIKPIHVDDVTESIISCLENKKTERKEYDLTGADKITFNNFIKEILYVRDIEKKTVHVPFSIVYVAISFLSLFLKNPPVTKDNLLGLKQVIDMKYDLASADFGFEPLSLREGLKRTFYGKNKEKVNVAVIGMGKMGILHASIVNQIGDIAHLSAIVDSNASLKTQIKSIGIGAHFFTSLDKMIELVSPDAVFISVPPFLNKVLSEKCIQSGISVFVEKPLAESLESAKEMVTLAKKKKVVTATGYMVGYIPLNNKLKSLVLKKEVGDISKIKSHFFISQVFSKKSSSSSWYYDKRKSGGGCLMTMGSHLIFLLYELFGPIEKVKGTTTKMYTNVEDSVSVLGVLKSGVPISIEGSWMKKGYPNLEIGITIEGSKGVIEATQNKITIKYKGGGEKKNFPYDAEDPSSFELGGKGYYAQNKEFLQSVRKGETAMTNWDKTLYVQKVIDAVYHSSEKSKEEYIEG
jgi:predicted dehydrogenase/nucleoside-diphosphate-sugar epimerase